MEENINETVGYPIGEQDFKGLRRMECVYVDKTLYIHKLLSTKGKYYFLARPRRFGKSLFLSTLKYFFQGKKELFQGLYIASTDWDWEEYPVLYMDLNTDRYTEKGMLEVVLDNMFRKWEGEFGITEIAASLSQRFSNIIAGAHEKTGKEVVILVDEYDKALVGNLNHDDNFEYYRSLLAAVYSNFKSSAEHIRMVFLTGVSRFSKLSVFSDLNNLKDLTFSPAYADICGITEGELLDNFQIGIHALARMKKTTYEGACRLLKENYDGYHFAPGGSDVYNPWSLLNALDQSRIDYYWVHTGFPTIIAEALRRVNADLERILNTRCPYSELTGFDLRAMTPLPLLYQTGYLTIKHYDEEEERVTLGVPNREVRKGLFDVLLPYYVSMRRDTPETVVREIINNIEDGKPELMVENLDVYLAGIPYEMALDNENNFHNAVYILLSLIGIRTETEVHTSDGRIDLIVKTRKYIYIIELKYGKDAGTAIRQIEEKGYDFPYRRDSRQLFLVGINFNTVTRRIDSPAIREVVKGI